MSSTGSSIAAPILEVDSDLSDTSSIRSSASSIHVSPADFVEEHGRTFHRFKEGKYPLPNDEQEQDRLDLQHHMMGILLDGKLQLAPFQDNTEEVQSILDIGTGTGIWAIEFAQQHPYTRVVGTDLSPIQPKYVQSNCEFRIEDAEDEWGVTEAFDFIHMRGMMTCFSDPKAVIQRSYDQCKPGAYLEMQDGEFPFHSLDDTLDGTCIDLWAKTCNEAGGRMGRPWNNAPHYKRWMEEAGFEDVVEKVFPIPLNSWPKRQKEKVLGMWFQADLMDAVGASKVLLIKVMGWSVDRAEAFVEAAKMDLRNRGLHGWMPVYIVYGRKPLAGAVEPQSKSELQRTESKIELESDQHQKPMEGVMESGPALDFEHTESKIVPEPEQEPRPMEGIVESGLAMESKPIEAAIEPEPILESNPMEGIIGPERVLDSKTEEGKVEPEQESIPIEGRIEPETVLESRPVEGLGLDSNPVQEREEPEPTLESIPSEEKVKLQTMLESKSIEGKTEPEQEQRQAESKVYQEPELEKEIIEDRVEVGPELKLTEGDIVPPANPEVRGL